MFTEKKFYEVTAGSHINDVLLSALLKANRTEKIVCFSFNGVKFEISKYCDYLFELKRYNAEKIQKNL